MPNYWLMKSEPDVYSIDDLKRDKTTSWEGVRNFSARNHMRAMEVGDLAFFYHSNANPPAVVGVVRIAKAAYPDHYAWNKRSKYFDEKSPRDNPRWFMVDVTYDRTLPRPVSLDEIKGTPALADMVLVKRGRLSVQPVTARQFKAIERMAARPRRD